MNIILIVLFICQNNGESVILNTIFFQKRTFIDRIEFNNSEHILLIYMSILGIHTYSPAEAETIKQQFRKYDKDKDGYISQEEFEQLIKEWV